MKEIPIILEATSSELFDESIMQSGIGDGDLSQSPPQDFSILMEDASMPIAVIGMGFRGPGDATDTNRLWQMILEKREAWSLIPKERWNNRAFYHPDHARHGTINVEGGHFITEDLSLFDAPFFNMTSDEAAAMDPQQRLLLEVTYESLENAGIPLTRVTGTQTSCFVGSFCADYTDLLLRDPECVPMYQCTNAGQSRAMMANRVSYFYDLKGPSVTVDTACSGSLVALHLACQSLRTGEASMAIAAGANLILSHEFMSTMSMMRFLSPDGRCHTFDEKANGYARGEAIACLILKPLASALRDGDTVRAIIRGTGSNQDGRTPGITLPSGTAQEALIRDVYTRAGLCPSETEVVEAHGTGTQAGDPVEVGAIARAFGLGHDLDQVLRIGSIKTNVGHLEGASGVAGVIKAIMMLENRVILPSRNLKTQNPRISFEEWNLKVPQAPEPWDTPGPHRVSVNSFGYGGSNAHVIIEDASGYLSERGLQQWFREPSQPTRKEQPIDGHSKISSPPQQRIFILSAFDERSCKAQIAMIREYLELMGDSTYDDFVDDLAFTLNEHRSSFMWKAAAVGTSVTDLYRTLSDTLSIRCSVRRPTLAFVFTGQGAQWAGMGRELLHAYPVFWESISRIDKYLAELGAPFFVSEELSRSPEDSQLNHPLLSQAICSALQIALVDLLASWNVYPSSVTGHSSGEIAAAYACGALSMQDAMAVAYFRGIAASQLLISSHAKGAMIAIGMSDEAIQEYLGRLNTGRAVVACINSPSSVTVSGDATAIEELTEMLKDKSVFLRRLAVDVAYHSHHMEIVAHEYLNSIEHISPRQDYAPAAHLGKVSMFSSVTGTEVQIKEMGAQYWVSNLLGQVRFSEALGNLCFETDNQQVMGGLMARKRGKRQGAAKKPSVDCLLEIGPHSALSGPIKQTIQEDTKLRTAEIIYLSMLSRKDNSVSSALRAMSILATMSYPLDYEAINFPKKGEVARKPQLLVDMPSYRWNHTRSYWAEPRISKNFRNREYPRTDLLGAPDNMACPFERRWRNYIRVSEIPWLQDHRIQSDMIFPAAGYIAMAIEAITQLIKDSDPIQGFTLQDVRIRAALIVPEAAGVEVLTCLRDSDKSLTNNPDRWYEFHIFSVAQESRWTEHCSGIIGAQIDTSVTDDEVSPDINDVAITPTTCDDTMNISVIDMPQLYRKLHDVGLQYGPCFSNLTCAHATQHGDAFAEVTIPDTRDMMPMNFEHQFLIHPCTLDSIFHAIFAALPDNMELETGPLVPVSLETMKISCQIQRSAGDVLSIYTHVRPELKNNVMASIIATGNVDSVSNMKPKLSIHGLRCARLEGYSSQIENKKGVPVAYGIEWQADPGFVSKENAGLLFRQRDMDQSGSLHRREEYDNYTAGLIKDAIVALSENKEQIFDSLHTRYRDILVAILQIHNRGNQAISYSGPASLREEVMAASGKMEDLLCAISYHLSQFPLRSLEAFRDAQEKIWGSYRNVTGRTPAYHAAANYLGLIGHKKPDISVLEIIDERNRANTFFLEGLAPRAGDHQSRIPHCTKYTFAYREDFALDQARADCTDWKDMVDFEKIDLNRDFSEQELSKQAYDVIIVPNFFYSTHSVKDGLLKIKSLLKPYGHLIILNTLQPERSLLDALIVSTFYHWPPRAVDPFIYGERTTGEILDEAGFRAEDVGKGSLIVCRPEYGANSSDKKILVIREDDNEMSKKLSEALMQHLPGELTVSNTAEALPRGQICIVLSDLARNMLQKPDDDLLQKMKEIFLQSEGVLWVTRGGTVHATNPQAALAVGFARTARSESGVQSILTLDLDPNFSILDDSRVKIIANLMKTHFFREGPPEFDTEYAERNGVVLVPRVVAQNELNYDITKMSKTVAFLEHPFHQPDRCLFLSRDEVGKKEVHFTASKQITEIPEGHVGIKVFAFAISEFDADSDQDQSNILGAVGLGCSGQVYDIGPNVHGFSVGDRVACVGTGTARNYYYDRASAFQKIDDNVSYEAAASLPLAYTVAYYIVNEVARVKRGDTVLIHDAASWYGQALFEICRLNESEVFAIVFNDAQKDELLKKSQIASRQVFIERKDNIRGRLLESTGGRLPRLIITPTNSNSKMLGSLCKLTAPFGHLIHLRTRLLNHQAKSSFSGDFKNISFSTFDMFDLNPDNLVQAHEIWLRIVSLFNEGKLREPPFYSVHRVTDITKAMSTVSSMSYAVVTAEGNDVVQATAPRASKTLFQKDASYLLVGGLGGIGRAIASWMVEHGAKNLVLVNRSGLFTDTARSTVRILREKGVEVAVRGCDISDERVFSEMCKEISQSMPPIKGVIQGAMILKDVHIEKMTAEDYNTVLQPKCTGTWNLHNYLPANLDFFVMLSSISGVIGNATQSAYAAGSAFMDSFAAYRNSLGLPAVSLDLGTVTDVGYLAENKELADKMAKQGFQSTDMRTMLSLVQLAISQPPTGTHAQIVTGLGEWKPGKSLANFDASLFSHFRRGFQINDPHEEGLGNTEPLRETLRASKTRDEAMLMVFEALSGKLAAQLEIPTDRISPGCSLSELGIDSTDAIDLRNWISKTMESTVPILEILASGSVLQLAGQIVSRSQLLNINDETP